MEVNDRSGSVSEWQGVTVVWSCSSPGALYPTSMRINEQGRLVVNFRTKARFRGLFVESHSGGRIKRAGETATLTLPFFSLFFFFTFYS